MTKQEAIDFVKLLPALPSNMVMKVEDGNNWYNKGGIRVLPVYGTLQDRWAALEADMRNLEGARAAYISNRFDGSEIKMADLSEKKLKVLHRQFIKKINKHNEDFNIILKFIQQDILFEFLRVNIHVNSLTFYTNHNTGAHAVNTGSREFTLHLSFRLNDEKVIPRELNSTRYVQMGADFVKFQKTLYHQQKKDEALLEPEKHEFTLKK